MLKELHEMKSKLKKTSEATKIMMHKKTDVQTFFHC